MLQLNKYFELKVLFEKVTFDSIFLYSMIFTFSFPVILPIEGVKKFESITNKDSSKIEIFLSNPFDFTQRLTKILPSILDKISHLKFPN